MKNKPTIITTSWDDGFKLDIKLAELLTKYNIKATFYTPIRNAERLVMETNLLKEIATEFEIGGHTINHIYLNKLNKPAAKHEISGCKYILQDTLGKEINAFCYPGGKFSKRDIELVQDAGFLFGRTTRLLHTTNLVKNNTFDTSVQAFNHSRCTLTKHCLKNSFLEPIFSNCFFLEENRNFEKLTETTLRRLQKTGGVFHLWGHSWEIEEYNLWAELESVFKMISSNKDFIFMDNTECWKLVSNQQKLKV